MATKDQNSRMPILLKTIDRRPQDNSPDGALLELINMRYTNGALRPVPEKLRLTVPSPQFKVLFKHVISESLYALWGIVSAHLTYALYEDEVLIDTDLTFQDITGDAVFSSVGNAVMISDQALEKTFVMLYQPDTQDYRPFDKFLPDISFIDFQRIASATDDEIKVVELELGSSGETIDLAFKGTAQDQFARMIAKGYLIGRHLVRCAWELFDGSIIMHTIPYYITISEIEGMWHEVIPGVVAVNVKFTGYKLQYKINITSADLAALKLQYKGIVKSFNIYLTNHQTLVDLHKVVMTEDLYYSMTMPAGYDVNMIATWLKNEIFYFELVKIGIDNLIAETFTDVLLTDTSTLSSGNVMPVGNLSIHRVFGKNLFSYNQRIFLGNIKNTLFPGTSLRGLLSPGSSPITGTPYYVGISFDLYTPDGTRRVFSGWQEYSNYRQYSMDTASDADIHTVNTIGKTGRVWATNGFAGMMVEITGGTGVGQTRIIASNTSNTLTVTVNWVTEPQNDSDFTVSRPDYFEFEVHDIIGYPDARAKSCDFWYTNSLTGGIIRHLGTTSIPLTQVFGMNFSFFIAFTGISYLVYVGPGSSHVETPINANDTYWDGDRVQACEFQNPYYFPAINSYRVDGFVLGMATNAVPLSQGQFGQFPIFVFTTKGIWALNLGDGDILITSIRPLSGTICINGRSILGIDGGVIFMSNEGLMILTGRDPISISDPVIGPPTSPLSGQTAYEKVINDPNTYQPKIYFDDVPFETYAVGANIAFVNVNLSNSLEKEIIISNPAYEYSYVYNIISKSWYRITQSWDSFIQDYPRMLGCKLDTTYFLDDLTHEQSVVDQEIMTHVETRPVKFGEEMSFKKIMRTLLYGWINPGDCKPYSFFLFGSTDGRNWFIQQASNTTIPQDKVAIGRSSFSCRSFIIVIGGYIRDDSYIQGLICDIEKRYANKLK